MEISEPKFLCSFGGKFVRQNKLFYIGGSNKILYVDRRISFSYIIAELSALFDVPGNISFKYQLPGGDLEELVSVTNGEDLKKLMLEFDQLYRDHPRTARIRLFVLSSNHPDSNPSSVKPYMPSDTPVKGHLSSFYNEDETGNQLMSDYLNWVAKENRHQVSFSNSNIWRFPGPVNVPQDIQCSSKLEHATSTQTRFSKAPNKFVRWTEDEHKLFLMGLEKYGKGRWKRICGEFLPTRNPAQVSSYAQKYFSRQKNDSQGKTKSKTDIHDMIDVLTSLQIAISNLNRSPSCIEPRNISDLLQNLITSVPQQERAHNDGTIFGFKPNTNSSVFHASSAVNSSAQNGQAEALPNPVTSTAQVQQERVNRHNNEATIGFNPNSNAGNMFQLSSAICSNTKNHEAEALSSHITSMPPVQQESVKPHNFGEPIDFGPNPNVDKTFSYSNTQNCQDDDHFHDIMSLVNLEPSDDVLI